VVAGGAPPGYGRNQDYGPGPTVSGLWLGDPLVVWRLDWRLVRESSRVRTRAHFRMATVRRVVREATRLLRTRTPIWAAMTSAWSDGGGSWMTAGPVAAVTLAVGGGDDWT